MKIQITQQYTDKILNKNMNVGDIIDVDAERAKILIDKGYALDLELDFEAKVFPVKRTRAKRK